MKELSVIRNVDSLGRVVIPKELRQAHSIKANDKLEMFVNDNGEIILKPYFNEKDKMKMLINEIVNKLNAAETINKEKAIEIVNTEYMKYSL